MATLLTPLRRIATPGGDVLHGMKCSDPGFAGFGEAYFSIIESGRVKGWKRHLRMTLNFVVAHGKVQVLVYDPGGTQRQSFVLGPDHADTHARLTIPPGLWVAFGGASASASVMANLANLTHDPSEAETRPLDFLTWEWL